MRKTLKFIGYVILLVGAVMGIAMGIALFTGQASGESLIVSIVAIVLMTVGNRMTRRKR
ncbi:MAG TPA: hypothetical protein PLH19_00100 [Anaerolineae bacterium]|nr:hypothetical protein [Anaerolineae bacterium]HQH36922.1 hypothetical protein [Anaerolineae bacterium]